MTTIVAIQDEAQRPLLESQQCGDYGTGEDARPQSETGQITFTANLGAIEAFAIIISIVIGSGIFTSPGSIDTNVPSPGTALVIWLIGGILAWTGASTMAELGTAIPGEGLLELAHRYECLLLNTNRIFRGCPTVFTLHLWRRIWILGSLDLDCCGYARNLGHFEYRAY
jgi:hypothetical protein